MRGGGGAVRPTPVFFAFDSKYLEATHIWKCLTLQTFFLRISLWKNKSINLAPFPLRALWNIGPKTAHGREVKGSATEIQYSFNYCEGYWPYLTELDFPKFTYFPSLLRNLCSFSLSFNHFSSSFKILGCHRPKNNAMFIFALRATSSLGSFYGPLYCSIEIYKCHLNLCFFNRTMTTEPK